MTDDRIETLIRKAIGGDSVAIDRILAMADTCEHAVVIVMAALVEHDDRGLVRARHVAVTSRDRQIVEVATAHLHGDGGRVDALARDHLVDHPDSLIVAWIASGGA